MTLQESLADGDIPFAPGELWNLPDFATPEYWWQVSVNRTWCAAMVDRLWHRTGDDAVLHELYGSVKRCTTFTMHLAPDPARAIRMPDRGGSEWFERGVRLGKVTHVGGLRLAHLLDGPRSFSPSPGVPRASVPRRCTRGRSRSCPG